MIFQISSSLSTPPIAAGMVCCGISPLINLNRVRSSLPNFHSSSRRAGPMPPPPPVPWQAEQPVWRYSVRPCWIASAFPVYGFNFSGLAGSAAATLLRCAPSSPTTRSPTSQQSVTFLVTMGAFFMLVSFSWGLWSFLFSGSNFCGHERYAVCLQNCLDVGCLALEGLIQFGFEGLVAFSDSHRDVEGKRYSAATTTQGNQLERCSALGDKIASPWSPDECHIDLASQEIFERFAGVLVRVGLGGIKQPIDDDIIAHNPALRERVMLRGVDMDTNLELCQARIIQRRNLETTLLHRGNDIGSAIIRCRPEHRIVPFGNANEHIALILIQRATH